MAKPKPDASSFTDDITASAQTVDRLRAVEEEAKEAHKSAKAATKEAVERHFQLIRERNPLFEGNAEE